MSHDASCSAASTAKAIRPPCCPGGTTPTSSTTRCPRHAEHGVDEAQITAMLVHNPARYFTGGQE